MKLLPFLNGKISYAIIKAEEPELTINPYFLENNLLIFFFKCFMLLLI